MERYTIRSAGAVSVEPEQLQAALERLARFEDLAFGLAGEQEEISKSLERLRGERREKTVQFRELMARKLTNTSMLLLLEQYGLKP